LALAAVARALRHAYLRRDHRSVRQRSRLARRGSEGRDAGGPRRRPGIRTRDDRRRDLANGIAVTEPILSVEELSCGFHTEDGYLRVVDRVSFAVAPGVTLGLVGESGCGKTVSALAVIGLLPRPAGVVESGRIALAGKELGAQGDPRELRRARGRQIG